MQIEPIKDGEKKSLRRYTKQIIENKQPVAIKNMTQFTRATFGANSEEYKKMLVILSDVKKDRVRDKRELLRRVEEIYKDANEKDHLTAVELTNDLWLV